MGRRLVELAGDYASGRENRADIVRDVDEIGRRYGPLLVEHGATLTDAVETFILFRGATLDAAQKVAGRYLLDPEELASAREQIAMLSDGVLIEVSRPFARVRTTSTRASRGSRQPVAVR